MVKYTLRKLLVLIPKALVISLVIFLALDLVPGDPLTRAVPPDTYAQMSEAMKEEFRESMGLNRPVLVRYISWITSAVQGDFGYSTSTGSNIGVMVASRLPYTIEIAFGGVLIATVLGLLLGFIAAVRKNTPLDYGATAFSVLGISVPDFFFGIIFILFFSLKLKWLPSGGRMPVGKPGLLARIPYMIMPSLTMAIGLLATLTRYTRGSMLDVMNRDYMKTARSKGLTETAVNFKHGFRNALIPCMTIICMRLPLLFCGSFVIESVFNYPAMGAMSIDALNANDIPVVMIGTMVNAIVLLVASTLVDIVTALLDPRIRLG